MIILGQPLQGQVCSPVHLYGENFEMSFFCFQIFHLIDLGVSEDKLFEDLMIMYIAQRQGIKLLLKQVFIGGSAKNEVWWQKVSLIKCI